MIAEIKLAFDTKNEKDPSEAISKILRNSYDYQRDNMVCDSEEDANGKTGWIFTFYLSDCDQSTKTKYTLGQIKDLIEEYL